MRRLRRKAALRAKDTSSVALYLRRHSPSNQSSVPAWDRLFHDSVTVDPAVLGQACDLREVRFCDASEWRQMAKLGHKRMAISVREADSAFYG